MDVARGLKYETKSRQSTTLYVFPTKIHVDADHPEEQVRLAVHYMEADTIPKDTLSAIAQNLGRAAFEMYPADPSSIVVMHYIDSLKKLDVHVPEDAVHTRAALTAAGGLPPLLNALKSVKAAKADACIILESVESEAASSIPERLANQVDMAMYVNVDVDAPVLTFIHWVTK